VRAAVRHLAGAQDHGVGGNDLFASVERDVQAGVVDPSVLDAFQHLHARARELGAVHPAGRLAERVPEGRRRALEHRDAVGGHFLSCFDQRPGARDPPMRQERLRIERRAARLPEQVERDVEADAAHADDRDVLADRGACGEHVGVADHLRMIESGDVGAARGDAGGDDYFVVGLEHRRCRAGAEDGPRPRAAQPLGEVRDRLGELLLAGHVLGEVELAAELGFALVERDRVAALGGMRRAG
jgi:hypothetical protein